MRSGFLSSSSRPLVIAGIAAGLTLTVFAWLANWWPALDVINNGLPLLGAGAVLVLLLALITRSWRLIVPAAMIAAINVTLVIAALQGNSPPQPQAAALQATWAAAFAQLRATARE